MKALLLAGFTLTALVATAQTPIATAVRTILTAESRHDHDKSVPALRREDLMVYQDKDRLMVRDFVPLTGANAGLELFLLIDDGASSDLGIQIPDLQRFIEHQPATTSIGIAYMRNGAAVIAKDLTSNHAEAAKALRLPVGAAGASPYLSLDDLLKRWPKSANRREVIFVSSGADPLGDSGTTNSYLQSTIERAQREGVIVYGIYAPTAGHAGHSYWRLTLAQGHLAQLAEETGGESYMLGLSAPVSFAPYLDQIAGHLEHQYRAEILVKPEAKGGLRHLRFATEVPNTELVGPDRVYVPASGAAAKGK